MPTPIPLKAYSKFEIRCILTDPSVDTKSLPKGFMPMNTHTFNRQVLPIFETRKQDLGRITLAAYKKMRTLPIRLIKIILLDAGLTTGND